MTGWINAVAVLEPAYAHSFERFVQDKVPGHDVTYWLEDRLGAVLPTDEDEVLFRLALFHDTSTEEICAVGERSYIMPVRYLGEVSRCVDHGLFDAVLSPLALACLELRDSSLLRGIASALTAEPAEFGGHPPDIVVV